MGLSSAAVPPLEVAGLDLGPALSEICAANRSDEKQVTTSIFYRVVGTTFCPNHLDWFGTIQELLTDLYFQSSYKHILLIIQLQNYRNYVADHKFTSPLTPPPPPEWSY
ncbi:PREDICTED: uncharacterized protein LOC109172814 isoform X2 [Ipomoea nil]|uniref:uncharacterized protein LOC109172814 isoform X2 n=1 Tax=Ipomoea nil TaxID=35883 RepID=UPI000901A730|nr:PREDICTED: uncharacterized protein LOC109172814 isoform X2 [Ipomoea nil]